MDIVMVIIGLTIGMGFGFLFSHMYDSKDGRIKGLIDQLRDADNTIFWLSEEKSFLEDENLHLKEWRDAIKSEVE